MSFWLYRHPHFEYIPCKTFVSLNRKEGKTRDSFQQEITGIQSLAYLSGKNAGEAELNGKEGTTRDSFQWEISTGNESSISMGNYKFTSVKLEVGVSGFMDILISNMYSATPLSLNRKLQV